MRRDVKVVTNRMLTHLEPLSSLFIPVEHYQRPHRQIGAPADGLPATERRRADLLPAGEVSRITRRGIRDKKWHSGFIKLAAKYRAPLLPACSTRNSALFYASTLVSPNLPLLLLMQQMFRRRNGSLPVNIGQQIAWSANGLIRRPRPAK